MTLGRKIALLALVNIVVLIGALAVFARLQLGLGTESLILGPARDHILGIATSFRLEMDTTPEVYHPNLLGAYKQRYNALFYLCDPEGHSLIGDDIEIPPEVRTQMRRGGPVREAPPKKRPEDLDDEDEREKRPPPKHGDRKKKRDGPDFRDGGDRVFFAMSSSPRGYWAGVRVPITGREGRRVSPGILLIRSDSLYNNGLFFDWRLWLGVTLGVVSLSAMCWIPFVRALTRSISEMSRVTGRIAHGEFDVKVDDVRNDQLGLLGSEINELAERLGNFVKNQKRFLGDIAHELSAPIARIQFALGILEQRAADSQQSHVTLLREEIQEMSLLVNELLSFSKAGMDPGGVPLSPVSVAAAIDRAISRETASNARIDVQVPADLFVMANEPYLIRAISNLVRNALRYAGEAGPISVTAALSGAKIAIIVADCGPGVPEEAIDELFAPFYRPESSRSRESGGVGLGLAIVKSCVEACKGTVSCRNRKPSGLEVTISFPA